MKCHSNVTYQPNFIPLSISRQVLGFLDCPHFYHPGAIFGALEILSYRSMSKEAYLKFGRVPDWCSLDQTPLEIDPLTKDKTPRRAFRESIDRRSSMDK